MNEKRPTSRKKSKPDPQLKSVPAWSVPEAQLRSEGMGADALRADYGITDQTLREIREFGEHALHRVEEFVEAFYVWLETKPEFHQFFGSSPGLLNRVKELQREYWREFLRAEVDDGYVAKRRLVGETHAKISLPLDVYFAAMNFSLGWYTDVIRSTAGFEDKAHSTIESLTRLVHLDTGIVVATFYRRMNEIITKQHQSLLELSTPVIRVWDQVVMLPIVGVVDTFRAAQMIERLLESIVKIEARVAILDVTGVSTIDTLVARHLIKTVTAARMLGAEVIVTGISPETAQTLTMVGVDLSMIRSSGSLRSGIAEAFRVLGQRIVVSQKDQ